MTERNKFDASEATMQDSTTQTMMEIDLVNKGSGVTYAKVPVVGGNTMGSCWTRMRRIWESGGTRPSWCL